MKMKRLISLAIALLLVCGMPVSAFAETWYVDDGDITVNATESGQTVTQGTQVDVPDSAPVITQHEGTATTNTVTINAEGNATANVTIQDVNINTGSRGGAAIRTAGAGNVVIELDGTNTVQSSGAYAGVQKSNFGNLTIADENGTDGSLKATGGRSGAGIGGGPLAGNNSSDITISGGTIEAIGGEDGAGIGGGGGGSGSNITITGGKVTATGKGSASGIGGGAGGNGDNITISGGNVEASGGERGSGIGGGGGCSGNNITISGSAEVTAKGGEDGAGIGGGAGNRGYDITISGGNVEASGGASASGIGGGAGNSGYNITITGSAEVIAKGGLSGAGIGGGQDGTGSNITVSGDAQVKAQGGRNRTYPNFTRYGSGAAIGDGGILDKDGGEVAPSTDDLTTKGKIEYYSPGANMENDNPINTVTGTYVPPQDEEKPPVDEEKPDRPSQSAAEGAYYAPLYRVINQDEKDIPHQAERKDGVLTVTVDAEFASLTGSLGGINALKEQGIDTIVFVTNGAASTFAISDLLAQGSTGDSYTLNHNGADVSFTLDNGADLGRILQ